MMQEMGFHSYRSRSQSTTKPMRWVMVDWAMAEEWMVAEMDWVAED